MADYNAPLEAALKKYDRAAEADATQAAEDERIELVKRFPLDDWPGMSLQQYALGQDNTRDSFCWWAEFGTPRVGSMKGGSARKHLIYRKSDGAWYYPKEYKDEKSAWAAVRAGFVDAFKYAKAGNWTEIDSIPGIYGAGALRTKALYCYFPGELLSITSVAHLRHFIRRAQISRTEELGYEPVRLNRALLEGLRAKHDFSGWSNWEIAHLLYRWAAPEDQKTVVKIAPGANAKYWDECRNGGFIRVGWGNTGDLLAFESKEAFRKKFAKKYTYDGNEPTITKKSNELWTLRDLQPGDLIVANQGTSHVLAVGEVIEPGYEFSPREHDEDDENQDFHHIVRVKWDTSYEQDIEPQKSWAMTTIKPVSQELMARIMAK